MKIAVNEITGFKELVTNVILFELEEEIKKNNYSIENQELNHYRDCKVVVTYPDGKKKIKECVLKPNLYIKNPSVFKVGNEVCLVEHLEGKHKGVKEIKLPLPSIDISKFDLENIEVLVNVNKEIIDNTSYNEEGCLEEEDKLINKNNSTSKVENTKKNVKKGCISIVAISVCMIISFFSFSSLVEELGFITYPFIVAGGFGLAKLTKPLWYSD